MKKIIIAAVVAAVGVSAFGAGGSCGPTKPKADEAWAYVWKFTGKQGAGKTNASVTKSDCNPQKDECTYRVPSSLKIQGYTYVCTPQYCADDALGFETQFAEENEVFYMTKPYAYMSLRGGVTTEIAHIIGKNKKQAEIYGKAKFELLPEDYSVTGPFPTSVWEIDYAGFGKYDLTNKRVTSVSGNFAGQVSAAWAWNVKKDICAFAGYWNCTTLLLECTGPTVAYGKWSVKYNKAGSKKYANGNETIKMPNWVKWLNK